MFDTAILLWLLLGADLSWEKGTVTTKTHTWIGIDFHTVGAEAIMEITPKFEETLITSLEPLRQGKGHISTTHARKAVGQAQRLAQVVPEAQPWASGLWAA